MSCSDDQELGLGTVLSPSADPRTIVIDGRVSWLAVMAVWDRHRIDGFTRHFGGVKGRGTVEWLAAAPEDDKRTVKALVVKDSPCARQDFTRDQAIALRKTNYVDGQAGEALWMAMPIADPVYDRKVWHPVHNYIDTVMPVFSIENFPQLKTQEPTQSWGSLSRKIGTVLEGLTLAEDSAEVVFGSLRGDAQGLTAGKTDVDGHA